MKKMLFSKVMWIGRATIFLVGLAVILALVLGAASVAFGADGKPFILGKATNAATKVTGLIGKVATGSALVVKNPSGGSALDLQVDGGQAPLKVNPEAGTATNLSADELDGEDASAYQHRVSGECAAGSAIRSIGSDGTTVACEPDDDGGTAVQSFKEELGTADRGPNEADDPVSYTKLKDVPGGIASRDADTLDGKNSSDFASAYRRTVVVSPVGSATQNGAALKSALSGITGASATNPYLLKVEPGVYDVGNSNTPLTMKEWVDIEGSGEGVTKIVASGTAGNTGTVVGASNSELRFLTVENTGGTGDAIAIFNPYTSGSTLRLTHVSAAASGSSTHNIGVVNHAAVTMTDVTATASGAGPLNIGVANNITSPTMTGVTARATGGASNVGVDNYNSSPVINDSTLEATGGSHVNYAISSSGGGTIRVNSSRLRATGPNNIIDSNSISGTTTTRIAASQLDGGPTSGLVTCAGVYDENYAFFASTCP